MTSPLSLYQRLRRAGCIIDSHYSDLYVLVDDISRPIVNEYIAGHMKCVTTFISQIDGREWYEISLAYDPYWEAFETIARFINQKDSQI